MASSSWKKSSRVGNAGETACATTAHQHSVGQAFSLPATQGETAYATTADQRFAAQVGQAFSLPGLLPRAARLISAVLLFGCIAWSAPKDGVELWSQKPVVRPHVPS